jgi:hypothetical protein
MTPNTLRGMPVRRGRTNPLRGLARAWQDMDAASPVQGVLVLLALVALIVGAGVDW